MEMEINFVRIIEKIGIVGLSILTLSIISWFVCLITGWDNDVSLFGMEFGIILFAIAAILDRVKDLLDL
jgi:hypothetical protein